MNDQKDIPNGKFKRGCIVGTTAAKAGMKKAGYLTKKPFIPKKTRETAAIQNDEEIAKLIFNALSILRGTALKAAQLISMETELIPEAYRKEFAKAASQVPPINKALTRKIITSGIGKPEKVFARFEQTPFAAASLGQVHGATSHAGEELAVKVQYPGIAQGVKSDIDMLKALLTLTKYAKIFASCFDEIQKKVNEELDYLNEAKNTEWFEKNFAFDNIIIPRVYREWSTTNIITTSRISGLHLDEWLDTNPSKKQRDHYGQMIVDFFNHSMFEKGVIHADPNPGNYLFRDDGKLGVIDFGCIKNLDQEFVTNFAKISDAYSRGDFKDEERLHNSIGIYYQHGEDDDAFKAFLKDWIEWLTRPYRQDYFDFSKEADYFKEGKYHGVELYRYVERYEGSFIYFGRAEHGLLRILQRLGAKVSMMKR